MIMRPNAPRTWVWSILAGGMAYGLVRTSRHKQSTGLLLGAGTAALMSTLMQRNKQFDATFDVPRVGWV